MAHAWVQSGVERFVNTYVNPIISTTVTQSNDLAKMVSDLSSEQRQIEKIKMNLVVSGRGESKSVDDDLKVSDLIVNKLKITHSLQVDFKNHQIYPLVVLNTTFFLTIPPLGEFDQ